MTFIKKSPTPSKNENIVLLCQNLQAGKQAINLTSLGLSALEIEYAKNEFEKKEKKTVLLNQLKRIIILQLIDAQEKEYQTIEMLRKAGDKIATCLNDNKKESVVVVDVANHPNAALAIAEGIALGNYQFIKYKTKDLKNDRHSLKKIFINSEGVSVKDIQIGRAHV